jgi:hypothetical protein
MELRRRKQVEEVIGYLCDVCSNSCFKETGNQRLHSTEHAVLSADWGFWSDGKDLTRHECHLCESCYEKVRKYIEQVLHGRVRVIDYSLAEDPNAKKTSGQDYLLDEPAE